MKEEMALSRMQAPGRGLGGWGQFFLTTKYTKHTKRFPVGADAHAVDRQKTNAKYG